MIGTIIKVSDKYLVAYEEYDFDLATNLGKSVEIHPESINNQYWNLPLGVSVFFILKDGKAKLGKFKHEVCNNCRDSLVVQTGEYEYSECPCVKDNEMEEKRFAQNIVTEICNLFHLQETKDWEEKAIQTLINYKNGR